MQSHDDRPAKDRYGREDESEADKLDRNTDELLQELRVSQTGTQILFAFLLTIAFTRQYQQADTFTHAVYAATLVLCALATAFIIAPVALHRALFRRGRRATLVELGGRFATTGLLLLMFAMGGCLLLALDIALPRGLALVVSAVAFAVIVVLWVVVPLAVRSRGGHDPHAATAS